MTVIDTNADSFEADVFERSHDIPVVVDFWASWCAPCRMLGPILEKLAEEYEGQFVLVKADTDSNAEAAARFQVEGIPAVFAVLGGEIVDFFSGVRPEPQLRVWLDQLADRRAFYDAQRLEATQPAEAEAKYRALLEHAPARAEAQLGLARTLFAQSHFAACRELLAELAERGFLEPEAERLKAALELQDLAGSDLSQREQAAQDHPDDLAAQLAFAEALAGQQRYEEALGCALAIVQRDKSGPGEQARQLMVDIFRVLPDDSELTSEYRRKLSLALY